MWEIQNRQPGHWGSGNHAHSGADYVQPTVGDWGRMRKLFISNGTKGSTCRTLLLSDGPVVRTEGRQCLIGGAEALSYSDRWWLPSNGVQPPCKKKKKSAVCHHKYSESYKWNDHFSGLLERRGWHWGGVWEAGPRRPLQVLIICDSKCP